MLKEPADMVFMLRERRIPAGHPGETGIDHIRRFFEHKLNIDVERYGILSCVGCGRCIETCPGNISIRKFIELGTGTNSINKTQRISVCP